jgi:phosphoglycerol transferase
MNQLHPRFKDLLIYIAAAVACCGLTFLLLDLWRADLRIPFVYGGGDELPICMWIKGVKDNPWMFHNSSLGMPFGLEMFNYPLPEAFHLFIFKLLGFTTRHTGKVLNLFYLATFPAILLCSLYALRQLGLSYPAALFSSFLYTFLPYHFRRGEAHLFLSAYYMVPLILLVIFRLFSGPQPFFERRSRSADGLLVRLRRNWGVVLICVILGSTGLGYYAFFACFLLVSGGAAAAIYRRQLAPLLNAMIVVALIGTTVLLNIAPNLLYGRRETALRPAADAETFGLKIAQLLLPINGHRLPAFAEAKAIYDNAPLVNENDTATLGMVGSLGFLFLLGWVGFRLMRSDVRWFDARERELLDSGALLLLFATLLGTIGGFGSLFAFLIQPQFRGYNRISVYIAFLSLFAIGLLIDRIARNHVRSTPAKAVGAGALLLLLMLGILDQTTPKLIPDYRAAKESFEQDETFVHSVEAVVPKSSMIFQLPYMDFPEAGNVNKMANYDLARGYLHSQTLRWSFGAMKGEAGDAWQRAITSMPLSDMVEAMVCAGFSGIYLDRFGYADNGTEIERELSRAIGEGPLVASPRLAFFSLAHHAKSLRTKMSDTEWRAYQDRLNPPFVVYETGFYPEEVTPGRVWRWSRGESSLRIFNLSSRPKALLLEMTLASGHTEDHSVQIKSPILNRDLAVNGTGKQLNEKILVPVGDTEIKFSCDAPRVATSGDPRVLVFGIANLSLKPEPAGP